MHQESHGSGEAREKGEDALTSMSSGADGKGNMDLMNEVERDAEDEDTQKTDRPDASKSMVESMQEMQEGIQVCRVCQCVDLEKGGEAALKSLGILSPLYSIVEKTTEQVQSNMKVDEDTYMVASPQLKITINDDKNISKDLFCSNNSLIIELGCACRSDLSLAHYACALRWFVGRGSLICEICAVSASNIRATDCDKVISTLKERNLLLHSSTHGLVNVQSLNSETMTPFRPVCGEAGLNDVCWFDPQGHLMHNLMDSIIDIPQERQPSRSISQGVKWAVEGAAILAATGLLTATITWLLTPHVSKVVARTGLNILFAGLCAFAIVIFLRFGILPRIKDGSARYWAILVVFWFLIFGVWASSTRSARTNP